MEPVWLLALLLGFAIAWLVLRGRAAPPSSDAAIALAADIRNIAERVNQIADVRTQQAVAEAAQQELRQSVEQTRQSLQGLLAVADERKRREEETLAGVRRLEAVFLGSQARGRAGENVVAEALSALPPDMVARNFQVGGKVVEFGLLMADGRCLPIDSKWAGADTLARLDGELSDAERARLVRDLEREVQRRAAEVAQYIDPAVTTDLAVAAIPDAVYALCWGSVVEAYKRRVVLVPYSMALPYVLALYRLHARYSQTVDMDRLKIRLGDLDHHLEEIDQILETRLARPTTMLSNAYNDLKRLVGQMRGDVVQLQATSASQPQIAEPETVDTPRLSGPS